MRPFAMGSEVEFAVAGSRAGQKVPASYAYELIRQQLFRDLACLPDQRGSGLFTAQGSRFYLDHGMHPEWCSPEVGSPAELVLYELAAERLLRGARDRLQAADPSLRLTILKNNLCPINPEANTYGCHEAYTCWVQAGRLGTVAEQLLPHLVTRIPYAGAGCLSADPEGTGFELSQRARHMTQPIGAETTHGRAIFSTRVKPSDISPAGWVRVHLISKDSHRLPLGAYLSYGTTALLIQRISAGQRVGARLQLADPVAAMRRLSRDPSLQLRLPLADGRQLTALEIQECYLDECERQTRRGEFPRWCRDVIGHWRRTLADLACEPRRLADRLDTYRKQLLFESLLEKQGLTWGQVRDACRVVHQLRRQFSPAVFRAVLADTSAGLPPDAVAAFLQATRVVGDVATLESLRFAVKLQRLELAYHELGGPFDVPAATCRPRGLVSEQAVQRASREPPAGGRAAARGRLIARFAREGGGRCGWQHLVDGQSGEVIDLGDAFEAREGTRDAARPPQQRGLLPALQDLLAELRR